MRSDRRRGVRWFLIFRSTLEEKNDYEEKKRNRKIEREKETFAEKDRRSIARESFDYYWL